MGVESGEEKGEYMRALALASVSLMLFWGLFFFNISSQEFR